MDLRIICLFITSVLLLGLAIFLFFAGKGQPSRVSFALVLCGGSLWSFAIGMFMLSGNMVIATGWAKIYYFAAAVIPPIFLFFSNYYLYPRYLITEYKFILWIMPFLCITVVIFHPTFFIEQAVQYDWGIDASVKFLGHLFYVIYFLIYLFIAYGILFEKLKKSEGINRGLVKIVIIGTIISYLVGIFFDLALPILGNYHYIYLGPYFTLVTFLFLVYLLFIKK